MAAVQNHGQLSVRGGYGLPSSSSLPPSESPFYFVVSFLCFPFFFLFLSSGREGEGEGGRRRGGRREEGRSEKAEGGRRGRRGNPSSKAQTHRRHLPQGSRHSCSLIFVLHASLVCGRGCRMSGLCCPCLDDRVDLRSSARALIRWCAASTLVSPAFSSCQIWKAWSRSPTTLQQWSKTDTSQDKSASMCTALSDKSTPRLAQVGLMLAAAGSTSTHLLPWLNSVSWKASTQGTPRRARLSEVRAATMFCFARVSRRGRRGVTVRKQRSAVRAHELPFKKQTLAALQPSSLETLHSNHQLTFRDQFIRSIVVIPAATSLIVAALSRFTLADMQPRPFVCVM